MSFAQKTTTYLLFIWNSLVFIVMWIFIRAAKVNFVQAFACPTENSYKGALLLPGSTTIMVNQLNDEYMDNNQ